MIKSLAPGRHGSNFKSMIFNFLMLNNTLGTNGENAPRWIPQNLWANIGMVNVLVMVTSHWLNQCWPRSMWPYGISRPKWEWVKSRGDTILHLFNSPILKGIFSIENIWISIYISLKFIPEGLTDKKSVLIPDNGWCWTGDKPLPEPRLNKIYDAIWH